MQHRSPSDSPWVGHSNKVGVFVGVVDLFLTRLWFILLSFSELSQQKVEGFYQKGQKSAQTGPDQQFQTNDSAPIS